MRIQDSSVVDIEQLDDREEEQSLIEMDPRQEELLCSARE